MDLIGPVDPIDGRTGIASRRRSTTSAGAAASIRPPEKHLNVESVDDERSEIVLRFPGKGDIAHPRSLVPDTVVQSEAQEKSLLRIGASVLALGIEGDGPYRAARDLLVRRPPRIGWHSPGQSLRPDHLTAEAAARDLVMRLDRSTLAIQGPPGTGKTWTGARMILDLVAAGKRVGVTANGHKVIGKLLNDVWDAAANDAALRRPADPVGPEAGRW